MHSEQNFEPVFSIELENCEAHFSLQNAQAWQNFKPKVAVSGDAECEHEASSGKLICRGGSIKVHCPQQRNINLKATEGRIYGTHPGGQLRLQNVIVDLSPRPDRTPNRIVDLVRDLGLLLGLSGLIALVLSPIFMPPEEMDYMIIAGSSIYLGLNGQTPRVLGLSISIGLLALVYPMIHLANTTGHWHFEPSLTYAIKIGMYLILWGAGKKIKDWYRGSVA